MSWAHAGPAGAPVGLGRTSIGNTVKRPVQRFAIPVQVGTWIIGDHDLVQAKTLARGPHIQGIFRAGAQAI